MKLKPFKCKAEIHFKPNKDGTGYDVDVLYLCDREKNCKRSERCGKECRFTTDHTHAEKFEMFGSDYENVS